MTETPRSDYVQIAPSGDITSTAEPFRFELDGHRFELPNLNSADIPLGLIPVVLAVRDADADPDIQVRIIATFVAWLQEDRTDVWRVIKRQKTPLAWVGGLLESWAKHSRLDPAQPASGD